MSITGTTLLTRPEFKEEVLKRDNGKCVMCEKLAVDAHHILDRKLFEDGGYYLDNGASLCETCHWDAERGNISCEDLREKIGVEKALLPNGLWEDVSYDKWGHPRDEEPPIITMV